MAMLILAIRRLPAATHCRFSSAFSLLEAAAAACSLMRSFLNRAKMLPRPLPPEPSSAAPANPPYIPAMLAMAAEEEAASLCYDRDHQLHRHHHPPVTAAMNDKEEERCCSNVCDLYTLCVYGVGTITGGPHL